jgi:hypothetical protein
MSLSRIALLSCLLTVACGADDGHNLENREPVVTGDPCALWASANACASDEACLWYINTQACQGGQPCPSGWCAQKPTAGSSDGGAGSGTGHAACACSGVGVCYEQIGSPAQSSGSSPEIGCFGPEICNLADVCLCITGQGRCAPSQAVSGLCICDNGLR